MTDAPKPNYELPLGGTSLFWAAKRVFDILFALCVVVVITILGIGLLILNPLYNPGPLFFTQKRMGRDNTAFTAIKFRTMLPVKEERTQSDAPLEVDRITPIGRWLRKTRFDELPQVLNILIGHMSLLGPRPEVYVHALEWLEKIPNYAERHRVRPGMSGLAQVRQGYVLGQEAITEKLVYDLDYLKKAGLRQELQLLKETFTTVASGDGH
ncbi:MAG: sugar transferase [Pseudomonadota bacterium]